MPVGSNLFFTGMNIFKVLLLYKLFVFRPTIRASAAWPAERKATDFLYSTRKT
jgi:hypothetical protein